MFRSGDKVTQLRNNYDKGKAGIFNGTVGVVTALSLHEQTPHRAHRRRRAAGLRLRRTRRTRPRLRRHHPPLPRQRIPRRGHPCHHRLLDDAAAQPALHRRHPRQNSSSSPDPAAHSPKPSAPAEQAAATPHSPTDSTPGRRANLNDPAASDSSSRGSRDPPRGATRWIRQDQADRSEPDDRPTTRLPTRCGVERKLKRANGEPTRAERHLVIFDYLRTHGLRNDRSDAPRVTAQVGRQARGDRVLAASPGTRSMSGTRS